MNGNGRRAISPGVGSSYRQRVAGFATFFIGIFAILTWAYFPGKTLSVHAQSKSAHVSATAEMLAYALNFRSASSLAVFGGKSVTEHGTSEFRGLVGSTGRIEGVQEDTLARRTLNSLTPSIATRSEAIRESADSDPAPPTTDMSRARRDLLDAFSAVDQLPCEQIDGDLSGETFGPGVYCVDSAALAGRMTVDAGGDANARFVFRVEGTFSAADSSSIVLKGGSQATNVYIFASRSATIGADAAVNGNIISRENVTVGRGSTVSGKVMGVNGDVTTDSDVLAAGTGYIEICKSVFQNNDGPGLIAPGTLFSFTISGITGTITVPAGGCSAPIKVASGNVTVTEVAAINTAVVNITTAPADRLVSPSLSLRQAVVSVPEGEITNETVVTFTNQSTRTGIIEICKYARDNDVSGFFTFTAQGAPGHFFTVPVGYCSGPITLTILDLNNGTFTANVTELAQPNYRLEEITTFPSNALNVWQADVGYDVNGNFLLNNQNGGYVNVDLNVVGGPQNQTAIRFYNRSLPGRIKICKITADPVNIPVGTAFTFEVNGYLGPAPGNRASVIFDVLAGPAAQGGFCAFAPATFVVGTPVLAFETGISLANTTTLPLGLTATSSGLRLSSITATTPFLSPADATAFYPPLAGLNNPEIISPYGGTVGHAVITARNTTAEMTFTNFVYRPAILKICKIAGAGITVGTPFTFSVSPLDPTTTWPYAIGPITVPAGACTFVNGPFPADLNFPGVGLFNYGTSVVITEAAAPGTLLSAITSPTLTGSTPPGTLLVDLPGRRGTMTLNQPLLPNNLFNEIAFTNTPTGSPTASSVSLGGRITSADGRGVRNALVTVDGHFMSEPMTTITGPFGYYRIDGLDAGGSYVVSVSSKQYRFASPTRLVSLVDDMLQVNFVAEP